jgi:hypothetical protein
MPQATVFGTAETASQEFGDGQIACEVLQGILELSLMRILNIPSQELPVRHCPRRALDRRDLKPCLAQQAVRNRSLAMNEFGSAFRGISELAGRKRVNAPAAPLPCFQQRHPPARSCEFACCHQASRAGADDDNVLRIGL